MAIESTDLFVVQRAADKKLYNINLGSLISQVPDELPEGTAPGDLLIWSGSEWLPGAVNELPDGNNDGDMLNWNGTEWQPIDNIDCGTY